MFHCNISCVILNRTFEYSANLDLSLQPLLKITDQSASDASVELKAGLHEATPSPQQGDAVA